MIRCIAVDDEPRALEVIRSHVQRVDDVDLVQTFVDPVKAISFVQKEAVDFVLLDIEMPEISGLDVAKSFGRDVLIVFTTAHSEYALESYDVSAVDYLLKPFDLPRFLVALGKVRERLSGSRDKKILFVDLGTQKKKIVVGELEYIESQGNYVEYVAGQDKSLVRSSMKDVLVLLPAGRFVQIHRSFIVAIDKVSRIEDNHVFVGGRSIPIGATFAKGFWRVVERGG